MQLKTARLTVLLDPARKQAFERACRADDMTPSQVLRNLIREFIEAREAKARALRPRRKPAPVPAVASAPAKRANARTG
ncbi:MAG: CopG family transcriptional regulator [Ramlibacter sp.]